MTVRPEILQPLVRSAEWLFSLRDGAGRIVCPEHRVEHTGKSACAAITAAELWRLGCGDRWAEAAIQQGRRLVANLEREGTSPCHTFRPGRHDPYNCSNSVIDGGACSDALAHLVRVLSGELSEADARDFAAASLLHARTYLRYAVLDKGIPAQRAWGLTGLAAAQTLEPDDDLVDAAVQAVGVLEGIQHADGSYPYHPAEWGGEHPGSGDVSAFYQSRVTGFLFHALEQLGRDATDELFAGPLVRGLDFLEALQEPSGIKVGALEAKPWYWGAEYEVASHPFDVHAFARGWRLFGRGSWGRAAQRAFEAWASHLDEAGRPRSHLPGPGRRKSYQCPVFWAAHACWMARAAEDLDELWEPEPAQPAAAGGGIELSMLHFSDAALVRLEDDRVVAWVRGARPGFNADHGAPHGFGLLRVIRKSDGASLLPRCRLGGAQQGEWSGHWGRPSLARGWRACGRELRFSLWRARVHARGRRWGEVWREPLRTFRDGVLAFGHSRVGSAFTLGVELSPRADGVRLTGPLSRRDGSEVPGSRVVRDFSIDGDGLVVCERLESAGSARGVSYRVPTEAVEVGESEGEVRYRLA